MCQTQGLWAKCDRERPAAHRDQKELADTEQHRENDPALSFLTSCRRWSRWKLFMNT